MARIHEHTVNIAAPLSLVNAIPLAMQGDSEADELKLHVLRGREPANMSGYTVGGYLERADGIRVVLSGSVKMDVVEVKLQEACYRVPGAYKAFVRLSKSTGEKMTLFLFAGWIENEGDGDIVDDESKIPSIEELVAMIEEIDRATSGANEARDNANAAAEEARTAVEEMRAAIENESSEQVQAIKNAGAGQVSTVQEAGAGQVQVVNAAGAAQQDAIQQKGEQTLATIPEDYTALAGDVSSLKDHIAESTNLVNLANITQDKFIASDGTIGDNSSYSISDYIKIEPGTKYTSHGLVAIAYYSEDKTFIARYYTTNGQVFTTSNNAHWLRVSSNVDPRKWQLNKSEALLEYDEHYKYLSGIRLPYDAVASKDAVIFSKSIDQMFNLNDSPAGNMSDYAAISAANVYAMFDELMNQYPSYITKELLGNDSEGNEISAYKLTPQRATVKLGTTLKEEAKIPTVFINCGLHGNEHSSTIVTYLFIKEMCEEWENNEILEVFRHDVNFIVIPVANPSGWNAYTRPNTAGVDLNRNFESGFAVRSGSEYGGEAPLSQPETQIIRRVLDENKIDIAVDFHETSSSSADSVNDICWIAASTTYDMHIGQSFCERISRKFKKEYAWAGAVEAYHGYVYYIDPLGSLKDDALATGCKFASTFEVINKWSIYDGATPFDDTHKKTTVECFANYLLCILRQLRREYHQMSEYLRA